ncbi:tryptophan synthase beta chain 1-like [Magnolia sinica]|uniref:tryptophan synthase beta chain 1-like n=1 Tax=Magnolia sinica TaxID=86752 RepID=UPI00265AB01C|nr:tryptophan synthase beta chain 1-like [Magnolia sinica]
MDITYRILPISHHRLHFTILRNPTYQRSQCPPLLSTMPGMSSNTSSRCIRTSHATTMPCIFDSGASRNQSSTNTLTEKEVAPATIGKFGKHGGKYVPETLISCLSQLEAEFNSIVGDTEFQAELAMTLRDYVGRKTPLYFAERLTEYHKNANGDGPLIYLKREDLNHSGAHKINNAIGQAMLAKRMGRNSVVAATGAGQHGLAVACACARLSLQCTIYMGSLDMEKQSSNVLLMKLLGAQVEGVEGSFKDATSQAIRDWVENLATTFYLLGTVVGPHPCPTMVREFQAVIGKETRQQAMEKWGGKPDVLVACVGSGSNAMGLFHEFVGDDEVRLIGVEAGGLGLESGKHSATLARGEVGVYHGAMSYLLQDDDGQIIGPHSIGVGLEYPGVGPELSFLKDTGRAEFYSVTDQQAVDAYKRLCRLEGIVPALEASHALAFLERLCPTLPNGTRVIVSCSGRGDKDVPTIFKFNHVPNDEMDTL